MTTALKALPAAALLALVMTAGADAQITANQQTYAANALACAKAPFCIKDSHNQIIGTPDGGDYLLRPIFYTGQARPYRLYWDSLGLGTAPYFNFGQPNCGGQAYFNVGVVRADGKYELYEVQGAENTSDGIAIPAGDPLMLKVYSAGPGPGSQCGNVFPGDEYTVLAQEAVIADTSLLVLYPPLGAR